MSKTKNRLISASQINTYEDCNRFWFFQRILRLSDGPPQAHFTFGTVLHAVCERYLSADMQGRVPFPKDVAEPGSSLPYSYNAATLEWSGGPLVGQKSGDPVDLYPDGWMTTVEMDGSSGMTVTPTEAKLIQRLVREAIEEGILVREEGTHVERKLLVPVIEGVDLIGYIDVYRAPNDEGRPEPVFEDHKTFGKGSIGYLMNEKPKTKNYLAKNQQLRTYAWAVAKLDGWDGDVVAKHNQFPKFPGRKVSQVQAPVPADVILTHGVYLQEVARRIVKTSRIEKWQDVPGPADTGKCSRWYGKPCAFSNICGLTETIDRYKERSELLIEEAKSGSRLDLPLPKPRKRSTKKKTMGLFDSVKKKASAPAAAAKTKAKPKAKAKTAPPKAAADGINGATPPAATPVENGAPWANPACPACQGRGVSSKGRGCPMCDAQAKKDDRPTSMAYIIEVDDEGLAAAVVRPKHQEAVEAAEYEPEWSEGEASEEAPAEPEPEEESTEAESDEAQEAPPEADDEVEYADADEVEAEEDTKTVAPKVSGKLKAANKAAAARATQGPAKKAAPAKTKKGSGRPRVGLTLLIGTVQIQGIARPTISSSALLERFGAELAADMGADSYWGLDTWKRRERLAQKASYIAEELGKHTVFHIGQLGNDDTGSLMRALMALPEGIDFIYTAAG